MAFTPIETEEAFNEAIKDRIARERAKYADYDAVKQKAAQYDDLISQKWEEKAKGYEADLTKEQQAKAAAEADKAKEKARADLAEKALSRYKIAAKYKLPSELADRIQGDTDKEMETDAEGLAKLVGAGRQATPRFSPDPKTDPSDRDAAKTAAYKALLDGLNNQQ